MRQTRIDKTQPVGATSDRSGPTPGYRQDSVGGRLGKFTRTNAGAIKIPATIARPGTLQYAGRVEYRSPEVTFSEKTTNSLRGVPVTWGHPQGTMVNATNARELQRGLTSDQPPETRVRFDGSDDEWLRTTLIITDAELISAIELADEQGLPIEVSAGYDVKYDPTPGTAPDGTRFDGQQVEVEINHVAVLALTPNPKARAGEGARVRLDNRSGRNLTGLDNKDSYDMDEELKAAQARADKAEARAEKAEARADAAEEKAEKAEARADAAEEKANEAGARFDAMDVDALVQARFDVLQNASQYLPADYDPRGKSDAQVRKDALEKAIGAEKLEGKSDIYIEARFDALCDSNQPAQYGVSKETREDAASDSKRESRIDNDDDAFRARLAEKAAK